MPTDDRRLEQALREAAPAVDTTDVVAGITRRRTRRRRNRRVVTGALAVVVLFAVSAVTVLATRDDSSSPHVAARGAQLRARVVVGDGAVDTDAGKVVAPKRVALDADPHLLRGPLSVGPTALSSASYDPGLQGVALSHLVRIDQSHVVDIVTFKATRVLSITEGEGARWALTQNFTTTGGRVPDAFLKRIPASGVPESTPLPVNAEPAGPIAAVGGAVWVPVRDGVLQFDPTGKYVDHIALPDAEHRWVALVGKFAYATDGKELRSLPVTGATIDTITYGPEILGLAAAGYDSRVLLPDEDGGTDHARVARTMSRTPVEVTAVLPDGFVPSGLASSTTRFWAVGTVAGSPAIALLGDDGMRATVVLENASDGAALAWTGANTVRVVSGGDLFEVAIP